MFQSKEELGTDTLQRLFQCKAWANDEMLTALEKLDGASPVIGLAIRALNHAYVVDRIFAAHMRQENHGYTSVNPAPLPSLAELSAAVRASDRDYIDYVEALGPGPLAERISFTFTDGASGRMSREEMLLHVITHGGYHRGQVSAVMILNAMAPPNDGLTTYLHKTEPAARRRAG